MQQWYKCPECGKDILYGINPCPYCKCSLAWSQQGPILYIPPFDAPQKQVVQSAASLQSAKKKTNPLVIILAIIGGCVLLFGTCAICLNSKSSSPASNQSTYSGPEVQYEITGTAKSVDVTMSNATGGTEQQSNVFLPCVYSYDRFPGRFLYISAQNNTDAGSVTVTIYLNGEAIKTAKSSGAYVIATVSASK